MLIYGFAIDICLYLSDVAITKFAIEYAYVQRCRIHQLFQNGVIRQQGYLRRAPPSDKGINSGLALSSSIRCGKNTENKAYERR